MVDTVQGLPATDVATLQKDARLLDTSLYINQELSLLEFNRRVLAQARDPAVPLLERLRFLTICSTNLDELFEIRVAGLIEQVELDVQSVGPDGLGPQATIRYSAVVKGDDFVEVGDRIVAGQPPLRIFEMRLKRLGDTTWPAGDAVTPK